MKHSFSRFASLGALTLLSSLLIAQAPPVATPPSDEEELLSLLNTPVTGASKREQRFIDSPQAVEIITGDEIRQEGIFRLQDALKLMTSVDVLEADNGYSAVGMRGVMQEGQPRSVQILVDGVPMYSPLGGPIDLANLPVPLGLIDKVEVVRGPSSTLYGANATSGVIAITTKRPGPGVAGEIRLARADKGTSRGDASLGLGSGPWSLSAGYDGYSMGASGFTAHYLGRPTLLRQYQDGPRSTNPASNPFFGSDAGHGSQAMVRTQYQSPNTTLWLSVGQADKWYGPETYFSFRAGSRTLMLAGWRQAWTPTFSTEVRLHRLNIKDTLSASPTLAFGFGDPGFLSNYTWNNQAVTQMEVQGNWTVTPDIFVVMGADTRKLEAQPSIFIGLPTGGNESASGGFLALDWRFLKNVNLSLGLRAENESLGGSRTSPRLAVVWNPSATSALRAGYYTSTRSPQVMEQRVNFTFFAGQLTPTPYGNLPVYAFIQPNPDLKPEKTTNLEVGYRQGLGQVTLDLTVYRMKFNSLINQQSGAPYVQPGAVTPPGVPVTFPARVMLPSQFVNVGDATNSGVEFAATWAIRKGWSTGFNATVLRFTKDNQTAPDPILGDQFAYTTRNKGNLWLRMHQGAFTAFAAVQRVGSTTAEGLSAVSAPYFEARPAYTQVHLNLGWECCKGVTLGAYARNAAKEFTLQGSVDPARQTPYQAMRREIGGTLSYRF